MKKYIKIKEVIKTPKILMPFKCDDGSHDWNEEECFNCGKTKDEVEDEENSEINFYK